MLQLELLIGDAMSLKDKRRVLVSLKDRLHRQYRVSVAEVDQQDALRSAVLGVAAVSNSTAHAQSVLDSVLTHVRSDRRVVLQDHQVEILTGH